MEVFVSLLFWGVIVGFGVWRFAVRREAERRRDDERCRAIAEERRLGECGEVVRFFHNHLGYIAKECIRRDELEALIDAGATGAELGEEIVRRVQEKNGIVLGYQTFGDASVDVKLTLPNRERHLYVVGKTGSGKTNLLRTLILQDLERGDGIGVLAPEAELLADEILPYIPERRLDDVVYFNPADTERPVTFNPLHLDEREDLDLRADETYTILSRVMGEVGPRMGEILRYAIYALLERPGTTLLDIFPLLDPHDAAFREQVVRETRDPEVARFFGETYAQFPKDAHLPIVNRLGRLTHPKVVRCVLCEPETSLNFREAMDAGKVLLFNLSDGLLGEQNSQLLGQLIVSKIQSAAMSRADVSQGERRHFWLYLDEFQNFVDVSATSYERMLSRARKYRLGLILAHQQTGQIPLSLLREVFGNVSTILGFAVSGEDAAKLSREFVTDYDGVADHVPPEALLNLKVGEAVCKIGPTTFPMRTYLADQRPNYKRAQDIMERSRRNYGIVPAERSEDRPVSPKAESLVERAFKDFDPGKPL